MPAAQNANAKTVSNQRLSLAYPVVTILLEVTGHNRE